MSEPNYGILNSGTGDMSITDSPISFRGGSTTAPPPVTNRGPGGFTINGRRASPVSAGGAEDVNIGGGGSAGAPRGGGGVGASRWPDAGGTAGGGTAGGGEFGDLATVRRFAEQICALGDGSDFIQVIKACAALQEMVRDFGGDMNREAVAFMEAATAVAAFGEALKDQAAQVAGVARDMSGD